MRKNTHRSSHTIAFNKISIKTYILSASLLFKNTYNCKHYVRLSIYNKFFKIFKLLPYLQCVIQKFDRI